MARFVSTSLILLLGLMAIGAAWGYPTRYVSPEFDACSLPDQGFAAHQDPEINDGITFTVSNSTSGNAVDAFVPGETYTHYDTRDNACNATVRPRGQLLTPLSPLIQPRGGLPSMQHYYASDSVTFSTNGATGATAAYQQNNMTLAVDAAATPVIEDEDDEPAGTDDSRGSIGVLSAAGALLSVAAAAAVF
eukprot:scaffold390895_cov30-Prasinocladus_malaysianus.AAC.1